MPFTLPNLDTLKVNTNNLDVRLTTLLGRYQVIPPAASGAVKPSTLETLIARTNALADVDTDRKSQQAVFIKLVNDLRRFLDVEAKEYERKLASMILLGSLLHRYFRLIKEYELWKSSTSLWGLSLFSPGNITTCRLFIAIREALQLPPDTTNFKENDLKILDEVTIVTALEQFQAYMMAGDKFLEYDHFKAKDNGRKFKEQLVEIIDEHKSQAAPVLQLFNTVIFLQSLEKKLQEQHKKVVEGLDSWIRDLKVTHSDFSHLPAVTIEAHLKEKVTDPELQARLIKLLETPHIEGLLYVPSDDEEEAEAVPTTHEKFIHEMKHCNAALTSYTMIGGYALILEVIEQAISELADKYSIDKDDRTIFDIFSSLEKHKMTKEDCYYLTAIGHLQYCIYQALNIESNPGDLTKIHKARGVALLQEFLGTKPDLDLLYFGRAPKLEREVALLQVKLARPDKPFAAVESAAGRVSEVESPGM